MESHECNMFNGLQTKKTPLCNHNEISNLEDVCYTIVVNLDVWWKKLNDGDETET